MLGRSDLTPSILLRSPELRQSCRLAMRQRAPPELLVREFCKLLKRTPRMNTRRSFARCDSLSVIGQSAIDYMFPHAVHSLENGCLTVSVSGLTFELALQEPVGSGKTRALIPDGLLSHAMDIRVGGGGANSAISVTRTAPKTEVRYLDSSAGGEKVRHHLSHPRLSARFLGLRETPVSVVLGKDSEKLIVRSAVEPAEALPERFNFDLAWAANGIVLANSVKDVPIMESLIESAKAGVSELVVVLTNSLPCAFVKERVLPHCAVVIASYDEFDQISGLEIPRSIDGALIAASWVRRRNPSALVFMTMGSAGVLVVDREGVATHVALRRPSPWKDVQATAALRATMLAGVGDSFAGGVVNGLSHGATCVTAAISGSVVGVDWMGHGAPISVGDFVCERVGHVTYVERSPVRQQKRMGGLLVATADFAFSRSAA
jgi:sugar/nucleoside kinase (ribokinase family)